MRAGCGRLPRAAAAPRGPRCVRLPGGHVNGKTQWTRVGPGWKSLSVVARKLTIRVRFLFLASRFFEACRLPS